MRIMMNDKQNMANKVAVAWTLPSNNHETNSPMVSRNEYKNTLRMEHPNLPLFRAGLSG
jgi:hypothetical protein